MSLIINGTILPTSGTITYGGTDITKVDVVKSGVRTTVWEKQTRYYANDFRHILGFCDGNGAEGVLVNYDTDNWYVFASQGYLGSFNLILTGVFSDYFNKAPLNSTRINFYIEFSYIGKEKANILLNTNSEFALIGTGLSINTIKNPSMIDKSQEHVLTYNNDTIINAPNNMIASTLGNEVHQYSGIAKFVCGFSPNSTTFNNIQVKQIQLGIAPNTGSGATSYMIFELKSKFLYFTFS